MAKLKLYHISETYINYMHGVDKKVQQNKGERRPYVGIVFEINNYKYFAPLESPKDNHNNIKSGGPVLKLNNGKLGIIGFNNMIPVKDGCLLDFSIENEEDEKYKQLLYNQLNYCNKKENREVILKRALTTYNKRTKDNNSFYKKICCDFKKLEGASKKFNPNYKRK